MLNRIILYTSAIMEVKSSMGIVVAAPTAGSCGALPATVMGAGHTMGLSTEDMAKAMLVAGLIGVFIAAGSTFAAEVCGCQAETGAGSGMAAAALVTMAEGTTEQALAAASMALQNTLGLICDPVAGLVEIPCAYRNASASVVGETGNVTIDLNPWAWSGDHSMARDLVPGSLFSSRRVAMERPSILDLPVTILDWFGVPKPEQMVGLTIL